MCGLRGEIFWLRLEAALWVIHYFHVVRVACFPDKANAPLVIDSNAVLPLPVAREFLQSVARRNF